MPDPIISPGRWVIELDGVFEKEIPGDESLQSAVEQEARDLEKSSGKQATYYHVDEVYSSEPQLVITETPTADGRYFMITGMEVGRAEYKGADLPVVFLLENGTPGDTIDFYAPDGITLLETYTLS